jgi:hypothetical protein
MSIGELDNADNLETENVAAWGEAMLTLNHTTGVRILGGCHETGIEQLRYIVNKSSLSVRRI